MTRQDQFEITKMKFWNIKYASYLKIIMKCLFCSV